MGPVTALVVLWPLATSKISNRIINFNTVTPVLRSHKARIMKPKLHNQKLVPFKVIPATLN